MVYYIDEDSLYLLCRGESFILYASVSRINDVIISHCFMSKLKTNVDLKYSQAYYYEIYTSLLYKAILSVCMYGGTWNVRAYRP